MANSQKDVTDEVKKKKKKMDEALEKPIEKEKKTEVTEEEINTRIMDKIKDEIDDDMYSFQNDKPTRERDYSYKPHISIPLIILISVVILCSIAYFIAVLIDGSSSVTHIIMSAVLSVFSILYLVVCLTSSRKNEFPVYITSLLLLLLLLLSMNRPTSETTISTKKTAAKTK